MENTIVEQSKVRNRPIKITDIAISKVPRTQLFGLTDSENAIIQEYHKVLLQNARELCERYRRNDMECAIVFSIITKEAILIEGTQERAVDFSQDSAANLFIKSAPDRTLIYMHNHPSTGTFSATDIKTFKDTPSLRSMTAVGHDGSVYVIERTYKSECERFIGDYARLANEYLEKGIINNGTRAINDMLKIASEYHIIYKKGAPKK